MQKLEVKTISNTTFTKIQGNVYTEVNGKKCQVKTKFSLNNIEIDKKRLGIVI